jgi:hypothetical protein
LRPHAPLRLLFAYDDREVLPGYHVTEVKTARFASLDCGANPESWTETVVQLWDVPAAPGERPMTVGKFLAILDKVAKDVGIDPASRLTFECGDEGSALRLYAAGSIAIRGEGAFVTLGKRLASCKPRDRWFEEHRIEKPLLLSPADAAGEQALRMAACCAPQASGACCG